MARDPRLSESEFYLENKETWQLQIDSYESGPAFKKAKYLFAHFRENPDNYKDRIKRCVPTGYARAVIQEYQSLLSRAEFSRDATAQEFMDWMDNCDRVGTTLGDYALTRIFPIGQAVGWTWVLVDKPMPGDDVDIQSRADEIQAGLFPYLVHYAPTSVINWEFDSQGQLEFITVRTGVPAKLRDVAGKTKTVLQLWDETGWAIYRESKDTGNKLLAEGEHNLGRVPFVAYVNGVNITTPYLGVSAIANIVYLNQRIFNTKSLLDEFLYRQCFNVLTLPKELMVDENAEIKVGTSNAIPVGMGEHTPGYVSPPVEPAEFLLKSMETDAHEIYKESGLVDRTGQQVASAMSGISRAFEFHSTNSMMVAKADGLVKFEEDVAALWELYEQKESGYTVNAPSDFDIRDATQELDEITKVLGLSLNLPTLKKERVRKAINALLPGASPEVIEAINNELDAVVIAAPAAPAESGLRDRFAARFGAPKVTP